MISFYNFNKDIRKLLDNLYSNFEKTNRQEASVKLYEFIEQLKLDNYDLYNIIIGLSFLDSYRLLIDKKGHNNLNDKELGILSLYEEIKDLDDLFFLISENPNFLNTFLFGSIKFNRLNLKGQANMLLQTSDEFALKFNKFYCIEKTEMFRNRSKEEIITLANNNQEAVFEVLNILDVLYLGNIKAFSKLLLQMLQIFYKWKKVLQIKKPELTFGLDDEILDIVENNTIDQIIYILSTNPILIEIIITDFLNYQKLDTHFKKEVEDSYNKLVSKDIKIKLKEV